jgi:hypothetical protein
MMARFTALAALVLVLAGCAHHDPKPAICDGKHRRPANPYGSVLPSIPGADVAKPPAPLPPPGPQSSIDPQSLVPCGDRA